MALGTIYDLRTNGFEAALPRRPEVRVRPRAALISARPGGRSGADRSCRLGRLRAIASPPSSVLAKDSEDEDCISNGLKPKSCARHSANLIRLRDDHLGWSLKIPATSQVTQIVCFWGTRLNAYHRPGVASLNGRSSTYCVKKDRHLEISNAR